MTALAALLLLFVAGSALGVRLDTRDWVKMTGLILVGLIPFGALAIRLGHLITADAVGPAMGGLVAVLAVRGGVWFALKCGALYHIGRALPSYGSSRRVTWRSAARAGGRRAGWSSRAGRSR